MGKLRTMVGTLKRNLETPKRDWPMDKRIEGAMRGYLATPGVQPFDLEHPVTLPEKLMWYKLFWDREGLVNIVDKYLFKSYVREQVGEGYTIPLLGVWESAEDFVRDWDSLPEEFCLKSTLQSDGRGIRIIRKKSETDRKAVYREVAQWLRLNSTLINSYCRAYYEATPRVIAERYEETIAGQLLDYKFFCFDGVPYCIYGVVNHFSDAEYPITYYTLDWEKLDVKTTGHRNDDIPRPKHLEEMTELAKKLSAGFPFVRVDFFDLPDKLYVSELTLYPGGGLFHYEPESFNRELGDLFRLPLEEDVRKKRA